MSDDVHSITGAHRSPSRWGAGAPGLALDELLTEIARGNDRVFGSFYDQLADKIWGLARHILRDIAQAEEVTQEVFLELWRSAPRYSPDKGTVTAWAMTVTHRRAVDRVRAAEASRGREQRAMFESSRDRPFDQISERVLEGESYRQLTQCLDQLSERQRETVLQVYYNARSCRDIAHAHAISPNTIKSRLHAALRRLRDCLDRGN